jgi:hypothetical protein
MPRQPTNPTLSIFLPFSLFNQSSDYLVDFCTASPAFSKSLPMPSMVLQADNPNTINNIPTYLIFITFQIQYLTPKSVQKLNP